MKKSIDIDLAAKMVDLISAMLNHKTCDVSSLTEEDLLRLLQTARAHSLAAMTADALEYQGIRCDSFVEAQAKAQRRKVLYEQKIKEVSEKLCEHKIWYMPLKGAILSRCYPAFYQREMKDIDILCDPGYRAEIKGIMEELGFTAMSYMELKDDVYHLPPFFVFEMHFELFDLKPNRIFQEYYKNISDRLIRTAPYEMRFTPEDQYIYITLHAYKHFINAGVGVRYLLDTFLFLNKYRDSLSWDIINREMEKLCAADFERTHRLLAQKVFSLQPLDENDRQLLDLYLMYGTHGAYERMIKNSASTDDGKTSKSRYLLKRIFPYGDDLPKKYSFFRSHRALLPALWLYRPARAIIKYPASLLKEVRILRKIDQ